MGIRTREEIERERYALKALRGDFNGITSAHDGRDVERACRASGCRKRLPGLRGSARPQRVVRRGTEYGDFGA